MALFSRRRVLGCLPAAMVLGQSSPERPPIRRPLRIVVAGGHPGDPEYGCGGTVARYTSLGNTVTMLYLNRGEKSCPPAADDPGIKVRTVEAAKACAILKAGAAFVGQCDGHAIVDREHYDVFRAIVAEERPDVLFTHWPMDSHPDHRAISSLSYDAWVKTGRPFALYFYEVSNGEDTQMFAPTDYVNISATEATKKAACYAHASQAPDKFYALQLAVCRFRGVESGYPVAEAFARHVQSARADLP